MKNTAVYTPYKWAVSSPIRQRLSVVFLVVVAAIWFAGFTGNARSQALSTSTSTSTPTPATTAVGGSANANNSSGNGASLSNALGVPTGQGAGHFSADSIFPAMTERDDVVPWSVLTSVKLKSERNHILPVFNMGQLALNQKTQRVQGYMMPLDPGEKQRHFLLASVPLTCPFCTPGGPESMIEVKTKTPVKYSMEPMVIEGRFLVLNDDSMGLYYRMTDANSVR